MGYSYDEYFVISNCVNDFYESQVKDIKNQEKILNDKKKELVIKFENEMRNYINEVLKSDEYVEFLKTYDIEELTFKSYRFYEVIVQYYEVTESFELIMADIRLKDKNLNFNGEYSVGFVRHYGLEYVYPDGVLENLGLDNGSEYIPEEIIEELFEIIENKLKKCNLHRKIELYYYNI